MFQLICLFTLWHKLIIFQALNMQYTHSFKGLEMWNFLFQVLCLYSVRIHTYCMYIVGTLPLKVEEAEKCNKASASLINRMVNIFSVYFTLFYCLIYKQGCKYIFSDTKTVFFSSLGVVVCRKIDSLKLWWPQNWEQMFRSLTCHCMKKWKFFLLSWQ